MDSAPTSAALRDDVTLHCGDCLDVLATLADGSIDSCVTDPPYHLVSIYKRFANEATVGNGAYGRHAKGFMGKQWDGGDIAQSVELWQQVYRVLKPGAHLLAFGGTRTYHRMVCAIEDAGFEVRDTIMWLYGSGFPKSHNVAKSIDKAERGVPHGGADPTSPNHGKFKGGCSVGAGPGQFMRVAGERAERELVEAAHQWVGWGTALKPACEPIVLARKPLSEGTVATNVLKHGVGALNIDGCRVPTESSDAAKMARCNTPGSGQMRGRDPVQTSRGMNGSDTAAKPLDTTQGRWPANVIHDGSEEVVAGFPDARSAGDYPSDSKTRNGVTNFGGDQGVLYSDSGSAARFFYCAKANKKERAGSKHPTVKPIKLLRYLVRLVTPKGGLVLDPFAGTGTTGEAAISEGFRAVLIEREAEYQADIRHRIATWAGAAVNIV